MAIQNKALLQQAICDGAFTAPQAVQGPNGPVLRSGQVSPALLAYVSTLSDANILAVLTVYVQGKTASYQKQISTVQAQLTNLSTQLSTLESQVIN